MYEKNVAGIKAYRHFILHVERKSTDNVPSAIETNIDQVTYNNHQGLEIS